MGAHTSKDKGQNEEAQPIPYYTMSERDKRLLTSNWPIVFLFGQSGAGKSTFINLIAHEQQAVGDDIDSCTSKTTLVEARIDGNPVVVVDTPGIDDTRSGVSESDVLATIARCLELSGRQNNWVTGVLYLHRITDVKFTPTAARVATMLKHLCGEGQMNRVMFCTTMWDLEPPPAMVQSGPGEFAQRHDQLCKNTILEDMIKNGARTAKHSNRKDNAQENAEKVVSGLIKDLRPGPLAIQDEMIKGGKTAGESGAGQVLTRHLDKEKSIVEGEITDLRQQMSAADKAKLTELKRELDARQKKVKELERQRKRLRARYNDHSPGCIIF